MASEQAETYLRLMAEAELRRALTLPKVRERRHRRFPSMRVVRFAFHRLGLRRLPSSVTLRAQSGRPRRLRTGPVGWYAHHAISIGRGRQRHASDGMRRLATAANALAAVDAIDEEVGREVITNHGFALELRQRIFAGWRYHTGRRASGPPAGLYRAVGIAKRVALEIDGDTAEITLLALVIGPDRAMLTIAAKRRGEPDDDYDNAFAFLDGAKAVDNHGGSYGWSLSGGGGGEEWTGELEMHPAPRPGVRWLDLTFVPGTPPVRISLDQVVPSEPVIEPLPRSQLADRYLDRVAEQLFMHQSLAETEWCDGIAALLGAGLITPENPALARLVTLARRRGASVPSNLADRPDAELPERWLSVLDAKGAEDGPTGITVAAAVLPELDGSRWVVAGLRSGPACAELHVLGWGSSYQRSFHPRLDRTPDSSSWWARDSTGRWHVASTHSGNWDDEHSDLRLRLSPPLHPAATSIDVILTGKTGRVTVTLPVDWQADT